MALARKGMERERTAVVGDRLDTDVLGGKEAGLTTILVLSGVTTRLDLESSSIEPDMVFEDLRHFQESWSKVKGGSYDQDCLHSR
jgi:ribonucleotide monophosphatase NagD (HAD superfamily)